jgi:hypothetical protein
MEVVADYNITPKYFAVAEGGFSGRWLDEPAYPVKGEWYVFQGRGRQELLQPFQ